MTRCRPLVQRPNRGYCDRLHRTAGHTAAGRRCPRLPGGDRREGVSRDSCHHATRPARHPDAAVVPQERRGVAGRPAGRLPAGGRRQHGGQRRPWLAALGRPARVAAADVLPAPHPAVLPWHRAYLYYLELTLKEHEITATLPWWDWSAPLSHTERLPAAYTADTGPDEAPNPLAGADINDLAQQQGGPDSPAHTSRPVSYTHLTLPTNREV